MNYYINDLKRVLIKKYPSLQKYLRYNYGIDLSQIKEEGRASHYIFGVSSNLIKKIVMPSADWTEYAKQIDAERQSSPFIESMNCTVYGYLNAVEITMMGKFGIKTNWSDRWLGIKSGTTRNGNVPTKVADTARKIGLLPQELLPNNIEKFRWNEYYSYKDATMTPEQLDKEALKFFDTFDPIGYETVYPSIVAMAEALKYGTLYVAGSAWEQKNGVYYTFTDANHCFAIVNVQQAIAYKKAYDTYEPFFKTLGADFTVMWPKLLIINKKGQQFNIPFIKSLFEKGIKYLFRAEAHGEIYKITPLEIVKVEPQEWLDINIKEQATAKKLLPVSEDYFNNKILL